MTEEQAFKIAKNIGIYLGRIYLYEQSKRNRKHSLMVSRASSIHANSKSDNNGRVLRLHSVPSVTAGSDRLKPTEQRGNEPVKQRIISGAG